MNDRNSEPEPEVHRTQYEPEEDDSLCYTVVQAVGAVTGDDPTTVDPLYYSVDPEALENLVRSFRNTDSNGEERSVSFSINGCRVTVYGNGEIELLPRHGATERSREDEYN